MRRMVGLVVLVAVSLACGGQPREAAAPAPSEPTANTPDAAAEATAAADATAVTAGKADALRSFGAATAASRAGAPSAPQPGRPTQSTPVPGASDPDWLTYQHDIARSGLTPTPIDAANTRLLWESDQLDGQVYAQVLIAGSRVFAVTQNNTVYAMDAASGQVVWTRHLGDPVPRSELPCGNIDPTGITSTPTIDAKAGLLYAVDYLRQPARHELVALDVASGAIRFQQRVDPIDANPLPLQQRAALTLANGVVYVPFGGLLGDCGDYHGWIVSAAAINGFRRGAYQVPTHRQGAIWAAPALDAKGDLYVATGNGDSTSEFDQSNAVLRLSSSLQLLDMFAPRNWADLNRRDADLGSSPPVLLDNGQILQVGKEGVGYLLNATGLGQIGGEVFQAPVCAGGAYGGAGHVGTTAYVACRDGLYAVEVNGQSFSVIWHGPQFDAGAPTIAGDTVWTVDDGSTSLYGLSRADGSVLFRAPAGQASSPPHFLTTSAAGGRIFHSRGRTIVAYGSN